MMMSIVGDEGRKKRRGGDDDAQIAATETARAR